MSVAIWAYTIWMSFMWFVVVIADPTKKSDSPMSPNTIKAVRVMLFTAYVAFGIALVVNQ